jgi:hypothetical protein
MAQGSSGALRPYPLPNPSPEGSRGLQLAVAGRTRTGELPTPQNTVINAMLSPP